MNDMGITIFFGMGYGKVDMPEVQRSMGLRPDLRQRIGEGMEGQQTYSRGASLSELQPQGGSL